MTKPPPEFLRAVDKTLEIAMVGLYVFYILGFAFCVPLYALLLWAGVHKIAGVVHDLAWPAQVVAFALAWLTSTYAYWTIVLHVERRVNDLIEEIHFLRADVAYRLAQQKNDT